MQMISEKISREEKLSLELRSLYRSYGYQYYRMSSFEPYDLYRENKNFLVNQSVLTFTDLDGRLMALKPDITISIAKDALTGHNGRKLFYSEHVFRRLPGAQQFTELKQMGLEFIGGDTAYGECEVLELASKTLAAISPAYSLEISHMGYISAFVEQLTDDMRQQQDFTEALSRKSAVDMKLALAGKKLDDRELRTIDILTSLPADPALALAGMEQACLNQRMLSACRETEKLLAYAESRGFGGNIRPEPSLMYDGEYYNGLVFKGYISGLPRAVLSGGRYDKLLQRFGKEQPALGFALYFNELQDMKVDSSDYDIDILLLYDDEPAEMVGKAVDFLVGQGWSVRAERQAPENITARKICSIREIAECGKELKC